MPRQLRKIQAFPQMPATYTKRTGPIKKEGCLLHVP